MTHEESPGLLVWLGHAVVELCSHASLCSSSDALLCTIPNRCDSWREATDKFIKCHPGLRTMGAIISLPLEMWSIMTVLCRDPAGMVISSDKRHYPGHHLFCTE